MKIRIEPGERKFGNPIITDVTNQKEPLNYLWIGCDDICFGTISEEADLKKLIKSCQSILKHNSTKSAES